jgi:hypothetical protein
MCSGNRVFRVVTHTIILVCTECLCTLLYYMLILLLYLVPEEEKFVWCILAWDCARYLTCLCADQSYILESVHYFFGLALLSSRLGMLKIGIRA